MSYGAIPRPMRRCCKTGRELKPGETFYAALVRTDQGLQRLDYAPEAWSGPPENAIGYWKGRVPAAGGRKPRRRLDDQTAMELFEQLAAEDDNPRTPLLRYLLALHLMRRRILRLVRIEPRGAHDYIRLRHTREKTREWLVWCPALEEKELAELEGQFEELLAPLLDRRPGPHAA